MANSVHGNISLPGDKSISHRAAMIAAMAEGETRITNFAASADCASTLACIEALGVKVDRIGSTIVVNGVRKTGFSRPAASLYCGNSGTTMRLLAGILAGQNFASMMTGDESLQKRPMQRIIEPLARMGAVIGSADGTAPLSITGKQPLDAIVYQPPVASAQIKSCVLLAGLNSNGVTTVIEPDRSRDHTERMLRWFGVDVAVIEGLNGSEISVSGDSKLTARDLNVPSDISSAAFFLVAAACLAGSEITMPNVGLNPSRRAIYDVLVSAGVDITIDDDREVSNEPVGTLHIRGGLHRAKDQPQLMLGGGIIANLIDEIPILAVLGTQLPNGIEIRDAGELRVKESDRITSIVDNLRRMGAAVTEFPDGFRVERSVLKGSTIDSFGDHRIAMAFAVAGLLADGETEITGAECADISFPGFFETLASVVRS